MIVNPEIKDGLTKIMLNCFQHWKKLDGEKINNLSEGCFFHLFLLEIKLIFMYWVLNNFRFQCNMLLLKRYQAESSDESKSQSDESTDTNGS